MLNSSFERDPKKRRVKVPVDAQPLFAFDVGESSDDSDFRIEDHAEPSDDDSINTDANGENDSSSECDSDDDLDESSDQLNDDVHDKRNEDGKRDVVQEAVTKHSNLKLTEDQIKKIRICSGCLGDRSDDANEIVECDWCGVTVHEGCYGVSDTTSISSTASSCSTEPWFCEACRAGVTNPVCELCPNSGGIFKETDVGKWVHLVCALYCPNVAFGEVDQLSSVTLFEMPYNRWGAKTCTLCEDERFTRTGVCIGCDAGMCRTYFHVTCAQREGFLAEAHSDEVDQADPFYAHCKLHSDKTLVKQRKRNYMALQLYMKHRKSFDLDKERQNTKEQLRIRRKLLKYKKKYLSHKAEKMKPWVPTQKMPRLITTSSAACRQLLQKAELMGIDLVALEMQESQRAALTDIRKKWHLPPAFNIEFIGYYLDRNMRMKDMKQALQQLLEQSEQLKEQQGELRDKYDEIVKTNNEQSRVNTQLKELINKYHSLILTSCPTKPLPTLEHIERNTPSLTQKLNSKRTNQPITSLKQSSSFLNARESPPNRPVPTAAALKMGVGFPLSVAGTESGKVLSNEANAENFLMVECATCHRKHDQHLLTKCDTCQKHYHIYCLEPPLSRLPKKSKLYAWQCSECVKSSDSEKMITDIIKTQSKRKRKSAVKEMEYEYDDHRVRRKEKDSSKRDSSDVDVQHQSSVDGEIKEDVVDAPESDPVNPSLEEPAVPITSPISKLLKEYRVPRVRIKPIEQLIGSSGVKVPKEMNSSSPPKKLDKTYLSSFIIDNNSSSTHSHSPAEDPLSIDSSIPVPGILDNPENSSKKVISNSVSSPSITSHLNDLTTSSGKPKKRRHEKHRTRHSPDEGVSTTTGSHSKEHKRKRKRKQELQERDDSPLPAATSPPQPIILKIKSIPLPTGEKASTSKPQMFCVQNDVSTITSTTSSSKSFMRAPPPPKVDGNSKKINKLPSEFPKTTVENIKMRTRLLSVCVGGTSQPPPFMRPRLRSTCEPGTSSPIKSLLPPSSDQIKVPTRPGRFKSPNSGTFGQVSVKKTVTDASCCVCKENIVSKADTVDCDECRKYYHFQCLDPPLKKTPKRRGYSWHCADCDPTLTEDQIKKIRICSGCLGDRSDDANEIVECDWCGVTVHEGCYGVSDTTSISSTASSCSTEPWFCEACRAGVTNPVCELCPNSGGIFKETDVGKWVHLVCALYCPNVAFGEVDQLSSVTLFEMPYNRWGAKTCTLCEDERFTRTGVCIGCDAGMCRTYFHVTCAQREGFLAEAHSDEVDQADPFYAHCKLHSDKTLVKQRKRNYMALQLYMKHRKSFDLDKERQNTKEQLRIRRKLLKYKKKYLSHKAEKMKPWVPTQKMPRLITTSSAACRQLLQKAELMGIDLVALEMQESQRAALTDIRKKWHLPPAFNIEFIGYYLDRNMRMKDMKQALQQLLEQSEQLKEQQGELRDKYDEIVKTNNEQSRVNTQLKELINKYHSLILTSCPTKPLPTLEHIERNTPSLTQKLNSKRTNQPITSLKQSSSFLNARESPPNRPVPTAAALKMGVGFPLSVAGTESGKVLSNEANAENFLMVECATCHRKHDQHLLTKCDTCQKHYHIYCLEPPLSRLPKKSKLYAWQCSECVKSSDSEKMITDIIKTQSKRKRKSAVKEMEYEYDDHRVRRKEKDSSKRDSSDVDVQHQSSVDGEIKEDVVDAPESDPVNPSLEEPAVPITSPISKLLKEYRVPRVRIKPIEQLIGSSGVKVPKEMNSSSPPKKLDKTYLSSFIIDNNSSSTHSHSPAEDPLSIDSSIPVPGILDNPENSSKKVISNSVSSPSITSHLNDLTTSSGKPKKRRHEKHRTRHSPDEGVSTTTGSHSKEHKRKRKRKQELQERDDSPLPAATSPPQPIILKIKSIPLPTGEKASTSKPQMFCVQNDVSTITSTTSSSKSFMRAPPPPKVDGNSKKINKLPSEFPKTTVENIKMRTRLLSVCVGGTSQPPPFMRPRLRSTCEPGTSSPIKSLLPPSSDQIKVPTRPGRFKSPNSGTFGQVSVKKTVTDASCCVCKENIVSKADTVDCDECRKYYHFQCLDPPLKKTPKRRGYSWHCADCDPTDTE